MVLAKRGVIVEISEFNKKAVEYMANFHKIKAYLYDLNNDKLNKIVEGKYEIITLRACIMFAKDLSKLASTLFDLLNQEGKLIINKSVKPTLDVFTRTKLDQYTYYFLRQPENIEKHFGQFNFLKKNLDVIFSLIIINFV